MGKISFVKGQGGLSRRLPGEDHISAMIFYATIAITGFVTNKINKVYQLLDAEALGIVADASADVLIRIIHYHVSEFYRINPGATLFIAVYDAPEDFTDYAYPEIATVQNFAEGTVRNMGIWCSEEFDESGGRDA